MICIVYSRVSTEDQARHGYSLPDQREQGAARAAALGYSPAQIIHLADEGISGEILERPALSRARELIRAGGVHRRAGSRRRVRRLCCRPRRGHPRPAEAGISYPGRLRPRLE
jgi:DNA invertase Pin-like site-specific DNA recombinase